jgi:hypothetical protein
MKIDLVKNILYQSFNKFDNYTVVTYSWDMYSHMESDNRTISNVSIFIHTHIYVYTYMHMYIHIYITQTCSPI